MKYSVLIDEEELTDYAIIPISEQLALDDSLDQAFVKLKFTSKQNAYKPFTTVIVNISDDFSNTRQLSYFVSSDNKTEIVADGTYSHDLLCVEQTKWFERFLTGTKTVTNPLIHDYTSAFTPMDVYVSRMSFYIGQQLSPEYDYFYDNSYQDIIDLTQQTTLQCLSPLQWKNHMHPSGSVLSSTLTITIDGESREYTSSTAPLLTLKEGIYSFKYKFRTGDDFIEEDTFNISVIRTARQQSRKTITNAIDSLLATIETIKTNETPRFSLAPEQALKYSQIDSPEFTLTGTLWEALRQIGTYIHAIPRLKDGIVYFDELGGDEKVATKLTDYISSTEQFDIEQFASAIDSTVQNIVNLDDLDEGSVVEPFRVGYKTPRTETGTVQITTDNMFIQTKEPIEKIIKVEVGYLKNGDIVGDITPYVYEATEYDALSSYEDNYPYAKAYAIKYTVGRKNITELNFKRQNPTAQVFENYAIKNIISRVTGTPITVIDQIFGDNIGDLSKLQFRVTYIPITTARIKQKKPYVDDLAFDSSLAYNQSAQKVSSRAYGEAIKGAIARLGNPQITKVFMLNDLSLIPKAGQLYDDEYYVSVVKCEYYQDFVKCSLGLSKDFNKLNEYVGINSEERFYEISEKNAENRYVLYEDYCVVGHNEQYSTKNFDTITVFQNNFSLITGDGIDEFKKIYSNYAIEVVDVMGQDSEGEFYFNYGFILPAVSYGVGNSSIFTFHYDDNYSAGEKVVIDSPTLLGDTILQNQLRYTDARGEIEYLSVVFCSIMSTDVDTYEESWQTGNGLPRDDTFNVGFESMIDSKILADTFPNDIVLKKDNRENIIFTYQIHYVCNDKNIVLGSLSYRNGLICKNNSDVVDDDFIDNFYILNTTIPKYAKTIDISHATHISRNDLILQDNTVNISPAAGSQISSTRKVGFTIYKKQNVSWNAKAWAIALANGELIVGGNTGFENDGTQEEIVSFEFVRKIN